MTAAMETRRPAAGPEAAGLWQNFAEANNSGSERLVAAAEDAVFRHYLPWARSFAAAAAADNSHGAARLAYRDAAELGLAQAILAWRRADGDRFGPFARRFIAGRIRRITREQP